MSAGQPLFSKYSSGGRDKLLAEQFDRGAISAKGLGYEKLDQLTMEVLLGVR
jgi:xylose isomerase